MNATQTQQGVAAAVAEHDRCQGAPSNVWGILTAMFPDATSDEKLAMSRAAWAVLDAR